MCCRTKVAARLALILFCRSGFFVGARDAELLHAEVERGSLDSETSSGTIGTGDNPASLLESLTDVISLGFFQRDSSQRLNFRAML